jgi:peptidoglycan/xylan/chitin deacetylase (PgdA/CDA1 family)
MRHPIALMFHGIDGPHSRAAGFSADPHYTVEASRFEAILDALLEAGCTVGAARDLIDAPPEDHSVWLTFDDGDASNLLEALPILAKRGLSADFFVNPGRVGSPGTMDWSALREMADAGMSIQSHGQTHAYFTHLSSDALREELRVSKQAIEDHLGHAVSLLAPPGGRVPRGLVELARGLGYRAVLGSVPGVITRRDGRELLPRVAVTAAHSEDTVRGWAVGGASALRRLRLRHVALASAKTLLGDTRYERWRHRALGTAP